MSMMSPTSQSWTELPHIVRDGTRWYLVTAIAQHLQTQPQNIRRRLNSTDHRDQCSIATPFELQSLKANGVVKPNAKTACLGHEGAVENLAKWFQGDRVSCVRIDGAPAAMTTSAHEMTPLTKIQSHLPRVIAPQCNSWSPPASMPLMLPSSVTAGTAEQQSTIGPIKLHALKRTFPRQVGKVTVGETLQRLKVDPEDVKPGQMWKIRLLHELVPRRIRPEKHLNVLKAACSVVLTGQAGKRSGTIRTRCTNRDLVKLGVFHERDVAYSGPYGELHRMTIVAKEDWEWRELEQRLPDYAASAMDSVGSQREASPDPDDQSHNSHDMQRESIGMDESRSGASHDAHSLSTNATVHTTIDPADLLLQPSSVESMERTDSPTSESVHSGPVFSREVLSRSPQPLPEWDQDEGGGIISY